MGYKAAIQILKQADDLRIKVLKKSDLLADSQSWTDQQKFQSLCHQVFLLDLEYALDKKLEQDLWNIGFKNHISQLQELTRDKKNPRRSECQALLTWCLEAASGFYLSLLHELCNAFDVDLPFRRRGIIYGQIITPSENIPQSSSCLYICQYCLVHLGDIARYRNQRKQAENFYKQAILVSPHSGHPYNQLAILEASKGDRLSTVFYYIRGIALKNPFPASTTNLLNTLNSTVDRECPLETVQTKLTVNEFIQIFLCTHALLHTATDLQHVEIGVKTVNTTMTALVATQSFSTEKLIQITAINLFALKHVTSRNPIEQFTEDEKIVRKYVMELLAGSLSAFLVPVHTLKNDESLLDYYALPAVKLLTYWIKNDPKVLQDAVFANRLQIWPSLCKLLNNIQTYLKGFDYNKYQSKPLEEDKHLQGFKPLSINLKQFDFKVCDDEEKVDKLIRAQRIIDFGVYITELDVNNIKLMVKTEDGDQINFEPACIQPDPTNDLLEEIKSFNVSDVSPLVRKIEKRGGILKPQGSLEKAREERELLSSGEPLSDLSASNGNAKKEPIKIKRTKQNVALQSIFKKLEENKQVKFNVEEDKEKLSFETKSNGNSAAQFSPQLRTQSFNQNHPAFPIPPNQPDYLNTLRNITKPPNTFVFPKTDVPPPNMVPPLLPFSAPPPKPMFSAPNMPPPASFNPRIMPPYQNGAFAGPYGAKIEEPNAPWWPNANPPNYQRPESFVNYPFGSNMTYMQSQPDFKPNSQAGGDMFNPTWNNFGRNTFEGNHEMAMRQNLKEANRPIQNHENVLQNSSNSAGYSLFNSNTWTPNLMGHLRSGKPQDNAMGYLPQNSLFTGQGPQSLAQLLEQQQSQKNDL